MDSLNFKLFSPPSHSSRASSVVSSHLVTRSPCPSSPPTSWLPSLRYVVTTTGGEAREEELVGVPQKELSFKVDEERRRRLVEGLGEEEVEERARLMSFTLPQAGTWLTVAPIRGPCPACRQHGDEYGRHAMNCSGSGERIGRYHHLRNHLHEVAVAAGLGLIFLIFIFSKIVKNVERKESFAWH